VGLLKGWKELKALAASGAPPTTTAQPQGPGQRPHHASMMVGLAGVMGQMFSPLLAMYGPERGRVLPGTEPQALSPATGGLDAGVAALRARDAAFDATALTTFAGQVFAAISSAWAANDPSGIRTVLSDASWDPISAVMTTGSAGGAAMYFGALRAEPVLTGLYAGTFYDSALFAVDVHVDLGPSMPAPPGMSTWPEEWLFQRSVQPGGDPMRVAETCPSCGAPASVDAAGRCTHCRQPVPVLTTGWLLTHVRSHNPVVEQYYPRMIAEFQSDPSKLAELPDAVARLLPPAILVGADPARAARLGVELPDATV
jgi:hypothetical protein